MINHIFKGLGVALITPFNEDDSIDYTALGNIIDYQVNNGIDYMVVLGTTGETPTLSEEEKKEVVRFTVERIAGRVPVVLGVGGNNTSAIVKKLKTDDFTGIDGILSVVPYYNKPSQEGMYQHFAAIAKASPVPVILYNVPGRVGVNMTAETTLRIAHEFENVVAILNFFGCCIREIVQRIHRNNLNVAQFVFVCLFPCGLSYTQTANNRVMNNSSFDSVNIVFF